MNGAYYNEFDPNAAAWLRQLILAGEIAPGDVDERSIEDVHPSDLRGYTQCHFFAGIGGWSRALRMAGWGDDRPVWSGSCPCQPFSSAGKGAAFADERHLWPAFFHLIAECGPAVVFGEQVASKDAEPWLDLVQDDLEGMGYAVGAVPFPSAGIGAPHIRDRMYWVADADDAGREGRRGVRERALECVARTGGVAGGLADPHGWNAGTEREQCGGEQRQFAPDGGVGGMADAGGQRRERGERFSAWCFDERENARWVKGDDGFVGIGETGYDNRPAGPINGFWRDADWLFCRDGKWRPVEPGTFPLVDGLPKGVVRGSRVGLAIDTDQTAEARVMRLRGYGNAINPVQAAIFIEAFMVGRA